jgi:hypothetical protein
MNGFRWGGQLGQAFFTRARLTTSPQVQAIQVPAPTIPAIQVPAPPIQFFRQPSPAIETTPPCPQGCAPAPPACLQMGQHQVGLVVDGRVACSACPTEIPPGLCDALRSLLAPGVTAPFQPAPQSPPVPFGCPRGQVRNRVTGQCEPDMMATIGPGLTQQLCDLVRAMERRPDLAQLAGAIRAALQSTGQQCQ